MGLTLGELSNNVVMFSVSPRLGYLVSLGPRVTLWPQISVAYGKGYFESGDLTTMSAGLAVPIVVQLAPHFLVGAGPDVRFTKSNYGVGGDGVIGSSGMSAMIGGYI